ncbi:hypothetical protein BDW62DRAFT_211425 [Aspergillus aurantiobrunneus]
MSALIEHSSENRRPRRPSITQQFQRMFHMDKAVNTSKNSSYEVPFNTGVMISTPNTPARSMRDNGTSDYVNYGPSEISSTRYSRHSYSSSNSKATGLNASESRHSSLKSFQLEPQQPARDSPVVDGQLQKQDIDGSSIASHSVVQKQDRRATKRLEAERLELEKRLLKLEEAERTGDTSLLRRESRRLTKKQPLRSSSRSSSVSGDESRSRPPSRLYSIFSSSRGRSRSRSSSTDGVDNAQITGCEEAPSNDNPNALPALSPTLPERLSTAISKELAARKNALLASPEQSLQSLKIATESTYPSSSQITIRDGGEVNSFVGAIPNDGIQPAEHLELETPELIDAQQRTDLDRALFTASLKSKKRSKSLSQSGHTSKTAQTKICSVDSEVSLRETKPRADDDQIGTTSKYRSTATPQGGSPKALLVRSSTDGVAQRHQKKFRSSPLAESQTINGDDVLSAPRRATTLANFQVFDTPRPQSPSLAEKEDRSKSSVTTYPDVSKTPNGRMLDKSTTMDAPPDISVKPSVTDARRARTFMSRIPTSKPSQLAPSALLTKPRFYNSLNKVTGHSGGKPKAIGTLSPPRRERESSPTVPPKSPKRRSRALSQSPDKDNRPRPTNSLSVDMSQESESDYNTADEAASTISKVSEDNGLPETLPRDSACAVFKKEVSSLAPVPTGSGSKKDSKKAAKKTRQTGCDQLVAKLFVICCRCKFWHDMPSEVYASLTASDPLSAALDQELAAWEQNTLSNRLPASTVGTRPLHESSTKPPKPEIQQKSLRTRVTTDIANGPVKCCWCEHHMSKQCCQGWTTVVQMRRRHH